MKNYDLTWAALRLVTFIAIAAPFTARANELVLPLEAFEAMGYVPAPKPALPSQNAPADLPLDLPWPVVFQDAAHTVAQNYVNYQSYSPGDQYFHGGTDCRSKGDSNVTATVSGTLEGGFYGYTDNADGSMDKQWNAWNGQSQHDPYFELAIVTDDGYRFEYHHIDSEKLPKSTLDALNKGGVHVQAGTMIGTVNDWAFASENYDHIHYNIVRADGVRLNPEYYSVAVPDHVAPKVQGVYGIQTNGAVVKITEGSTVTGPLSEVVVATTESHDGDAYVQTPPYAGIAFALGSRFNWDFRQFLAGPDGNWPDIRKVFAASVKVPAPGAKTLKTSGQYGTGLSLMRLPVQASDQGAFTITVADTSGNTTLLHATLK